MAQKAPGPEWMANKEEWVQFPLFHGEHFAGTGGSVEHALGISKLDAVFLLGLLIGEGHFGGDGRRAQVALKMHVRHEPMLQWLRGRVPGTTLYGPYLYDGRHFVQMMWRGRDLRDYLVPILDSLPWEQIDPHSYGRYCAMKRRYRL